MPDLFPKLRPLDVRPIDHEGEPHILLRDPQQLSEHQLLVPQPLAAVLAFCDGRHDVPAMVEAFRRHYRMRLPEDAVASLLDALDQAVMLENGRAAEARAAALAHYRSAPFRPPALAGAAYPDERSVLWEMLQEYLEEADGVAAQAIDWSRPVGLLSPHIDYPRGGAVYAQVWKTAAQAAREAELVILVGTDHYGSDLITLTRQHYATPYGTLPTDQALVDRLAAVVGEEEAYRGELRHRGEHSLELVAVWLHHMRAGNPVPVVPILAGSFYRFLADGSAPEEHPALAGLLAILGDAAARRRTLVVASGDLAHVGPAFGGAPLDAAARARVHAADHALIHAMAGGNSRAFLEAIRWEEDRNNVCGVAPIYLTMRLLGDRPGHLAGYTSCPADEEDTSAVTVAGVVWGGR
jgi:hypothetical protein